MAKRVTLTWTNRKQTYVEDVYLMEEDDVIYCNEEPVCTAGYIMSLRQRVIFCDETGIFGLNAAQIKNIKHLEEPTKENTNDN